MKLILHTISRDKQLYNANAVYDSGTLTVLKGSKINTNGGAAFKPSQEVVSLLNDKSIVNDQGILLKDIRFNSLSTAATFVTGRIANGMIVWKTENGKYVRETLKNQN